MNLNCTFMTWLVLSTCAPYNDVDCDQKNYSETRKSLIGGRRGQDVNVTGWGRGRCSCCRRSCGGGHVDGLRTHIEEAGGHRGSHRRSKGAVLSFLFVLVIPTWTLLSILDSVPGIWDCSTYVRTLRFSHAHSLLRV